MSENMILENNLKIIQEEFPNIYKYYESVSDKDSDKEYIVLDRSVQDEDIIAVQKNNRLYYFNSRYSDDEFSSKWANQYKNVNYKAIFVIMGLSNFSCVKKLMEHTGEQNLFLLYEPDKNIFGKVIQKIDITDIIIKKNVILTIKDVNDEVLSDFIFLAMDFSKIKHVKYCCMHNYDELYADEWRNLIKSIKERFEIVIMSRNTEILFAHEFVKNTIVNCKDMARQYSLRQLRNTFVELPNISDVPAVIVAAGPSLDKNIEDVRMAKGKSLIIAVDTALKSMLKKNIIPDLVVTVDPHKPPILFMDPRFKDIPVVACPCSNSELWLLHKGKRFYFSYDNTYMSYLYKNYTGETMLATESGGSVANNAFSLAQVLGMKTIIFVGQDLAYVNKKMHTSDAYGESKDDIIKNSKRYFEVEDIYGKKVLTENNMNLYRKWFEAQIERYRYLKVIDATEGGAKINGTEIMTLKEAIDRECKVSIDFEKIIQGIQRPFSEEDSNNILKKIEAMSEELIAAKKKIENGIRKYEKLEALSKKGKQNTSEFCKIITDIEELNKYVENEAILEFPSTYEKHTEYEVLSEVYDTKDELKDEIRDITDGGIKMLKSYIKGIELFLDDIAKEKELPIQELRTNIAEVLKIISAIGEKELTADITKINEFMKPFYKAVVRAINIMKDFNNSYGEELFFELEKIVDEHSKNNIVKMCEIIEGSFNECCIKIDKSFEV